MLSLNRILLLTMAKAFWLGLLPAACLAYPILQTLIKFKSRQTVSQYAPEGHQVKQGTPTMGGLIIVAAVLLDVIFLVISGALPGARVYAFAILAFAVIGFVDDFVVPRMIKGKRGLGWKQKIAMQFVLAMATVAIKGGESGPMFVYTVFLILFFSNAYNFLDGLDGLAGSVGICFFAAIGVLGLLSGYAFAAPVFAFAIIGATVPFLFLNAPPAKLFMGDVGSLPIGAAIGLMVSELAFPMTKMGAFDPVSEWYLGRPFNAYTGAGVVFIPEMLFALVLLSLLLAAELIPVPLQIASVKLRKKRIFTSTPIHHGFEAKGWPESRVVWRFALFQLLISVLAVCIVLVPATAPVRRDASLRTAVNR